MLADGEPGAFDEHCRRLPKAQLADLFDARTFGRGKAIRLDATLLNYHQDRLTGKEGQAHRTMGEFLTTAGVKPQFAVTDSVGAAGGGRRNTHVSEWRRLD